MPWSLPLITENLSANNFIAFLMQQKNLVSKLHPHPKCYCLHTFYFYIYINTKYLATIFALGSHIRWIKIRTEWIYFTFIFFLFPVSSIYFYRIKYFLLPKFPLPFPKFLFAFYFIWMQCMSATAHGISLIIWLLIRVGSIFLSSLNMMYRGMYLCVYIYCYFILLDVYSDSWIYS